MIKKTYLGPDSCAFPGDSQYPDIGPNPERFELRLKTGSRCYGIKEANPHTLRHSLTTRLVEEWTPLNIVLRILGHAPLETTRKYLYRNENVEREAIEAMPSYLDIDELTAAS